MISIHELLNKFVFNHKFKIILYFIFTVISYPLQNIYIPDYYGKVISSFKDGTNFVYMIKMLLFLYISVYKPINKPIELPISIKI